MDNLEMVNENKMNTLQRIFGIFFAPVKTMNDIAKKPNFLIALILIIVVSSVFMVVSFEGLKEYTNDMTEKSYEMMEQKGIEVPQNQKDLSANITKYTMMIGPITTVVGSIIMFLILTGLSMLALKIILGGEGTFKQYWSVIVYGDIIIVLAYLIKTAVYLFTKDYELALNVTSLKGLLPANEEITFMSTFAAAIDITNIWSYIVTGIGLAAVSKLSKSKVIAYIVIIYAIYLSFTAVSALMVSMFT